MQSTNEESLCDGVCERLQAECNQTGDLPPEKTTKTVSTSTEDIARKITEDKSTSTDDLEILDAKSGSMHSSVNLSDAGADDVKLADVLQDTNLTGATKAKFLENQLLSSQSQGGVEGRKFSAPTRYWTEPMLVDSFAVSTLQRASSSPSLLGESSRYQVKRHRNSKYVDYNLSYWNSCLERILFLAGVGQQRGLFFFFHRCVWRECI